MAEVAWPTSEPMDAFDYLMFKGEHEPSTRSAMVAVYVLDDTPGWEEVRHTFDQASRLFLRLRQHVVEGVGDARWVVDPDFDLHYHVRREAVPGPGTMDDLLPAIETLLMAPLDTTRPLWEAVLYEGLPEGRCALVVKASHSITDGIGGIRFNLLIFDAEADAPLRPMPPQPISEDLTTDELIRRELRDLPRSVGGSITRALERAGRLGIAAASAPARTVGDVVEYAQSARRLLSPSLSPSPLLGGRSASRRVFWTEVPLNDLRRAAKAAGGSLNDAYLAALSGALGRYHRRLGVPVDIVSIAVPISIRTAGDEMGGNHFAGASFDAPVGEPDAAKRIDEIGATMRAARAEPALALMNLAAPVLSRLPTAVMRNLTKRIPTPDVQASNIPGHRGDVFFRGCKVGKAFGFGPLPGCAMMVVLLSHGDTCSVTGHYDPAAIIEPAVLVDCMREGFAEVLALGGTQAARYAPARPRPASKRTSPTP
jgi:diacylglycerol O-acyltransferase